MEMIWVDIETKKSLLRLRDVKAVRAISNNEQERLSKWDF